MRIDARRGRRTGTGSGFSGTATDPNIAQGISQLLEIPAEIHAKQQAQADSLTLANIKAQASQGFSDRYRSARDGFTGEGEGFADNLQADYDADIDELVAAQPQRIQHQAKLSLTNLRNNQINAAREFEYNQRNRWLINGSNEWSQNAVNAIATDPDQYGSLRQDIDGVVGALPERFQGEARGQIRNNLAQAYGNSLIEQRPHDLIEVLNSGDLDGDLDDSAKARLLGGANREIEHRQRQAEIEARRAEAQTRQRVSLIADDFDDALEAGLPIGEDRIAEFQALASNADPQTANEINEKILLTQEAQTISELPPQEAQAQIGALRDHITSDGDASGFEARRLTSLQKAAEGKRRRLSSDAVEAGITERRIAPLDLDRLSLSAIEARVAQSKEYALENGVEAKAFTDTEATQFATQIRDSEQGFLLATGLAGTKTGSELLSQIFPKEPDFVHMAGLAANGVEKSFLDDARAGIAARQEKGFVSRVKRSEADAVRTQFFGTSLQVLPDTERAINRTAAAVYEERARRLGLSDDQFDSGIYEKALIEASGGRFDDRGVQFGGFTGYKPKGQSRAQVIVPGWMRASHFQFKFSSLKDDQFARAGGKAFDEDGAPIDARQLVRGTPVSTGNGRYAIRFGKDQWAFGEDGKHYQINLNKIRSELE